MAKKPAKKARAGQARKSGGKVRDLAAKSVGGSKAAAVKGGIIIIDNLQGQRPLGRPTAQPPH
jgi:hypothetical protein